MKMSVLVEKTNHLSLSCHIASVHQSSHDTEFFFTERPKFRKYTKKDGDKNDNRKTNSIKLFNPGPSVFYKC